MKIRARNSSPSDAPPERGTFFRLEEYERVGILVYDILKRRVFSLWARIPKLSLRLPRTCTCEHDTGPLKLVSGLSGEEFS